MSSLKQKIAIAVILFLSSLTFFYACVHSEPKQPTNLGDTEGEIWELVLTGDIEANCKIVLRQSRTEKDTYFISGKFSGKIQDEQWGPGRLKCEIKGRTAKSVFVVKISGYAYMDEGDALGHHSVWGKLRGTLSKSQGFGTWGIRHHYGAPSGEWTAKKIR